MTSASGKQQGSSCIATQRSDRGFSRKVQRLVKQLEREARRAGEGPTETGGGGRSERYEPKNWKQLSERELSRMGAVGRSRYQAYEPASKDVSERQQASLKRVRERRDKQKLVQQDTLTLSQLVELERDSELVGQLKAAEARHRVKSLRKHYEHEQHMDLRHLINSQPTSIEAVRLKTFLRPHPPNHTHLTPLHHTADILTRSQRKRCEILIEDDRGSTINRLP